MKRLKEGQKRMKEKLGKEFFSLQNEIFEKQKKQSLQMEEIRKVKSGLDLTDKNINDLFAVIAKKKW